MKKILLACSLFLSLLIPSLSAYAADSICRCEPQSTSDSKVSSCSCNLDTHFRVPGSFPAGGNEVIWIFCQSTLKPDDNKPTTYKFFTVTNFGYDNSPTRHVACGLDTFDTNESRPSRPIGHGFGIRGYVTMVIV